MILYKFFKQSAFYGISSVLGRVLNYFLTPYLTRIMTVEEYGEITYLYSVIPLLLVFFSFGLETTIIRFFLRYRQLSRTIYTMSIMIVITLALIGGIGCFFIENNLYKLIVCIVIFDSFLNVSLSVLRVEEKAFKFSMIRLFFICFNIGVLLFLFNSNIIALQKYDKVALYVIANTVTSFTALLYSFFINRKYSFLKWRIVLKSILAFAFPLVIAGLIGISFEFIDRQLISYLFEENSQKHTLGIYGAMIKLTVILTLFVQVYRFTLEPMLLSNKKDNKEVNTVILRLYVIISITVSFFIIFNRDIFSSFVGKAFRERLDILPSLFLAVVLSGILVNFSVWYKAINKNYIGIITGILGIISILVGSYLLIPIYGLVGLIISKIIGILVMIVSNDLLATHYKVGIKTRWLYINLFLGVCIYFLFNLFDIKWTLFSILPITVYVLISITIDSSLKALFYEFKNKVLKIW